MATTSTPAFAAASVEAERYVLDCARSGRLADLSARPPPQRRISASFVESLIFGSDGEQELRGPLRIRGAEVVGKLCPPPGTREDGYPALLFWECTFDEPLDLSAGDFLSLRFVSCTLPALIGASLGTKADLDLSGSRFTGVSDYHGELSEVGTCAIHLSNARIGGRLLMRSTPEAVFTARGTVRLDGARIEGTVSLEGAVLDGRGDEALNARSMSVGGNVNFGWGGNRRFEAIGEVALAAARITGDLSLRGAKLTNPEGRALHCEDLRVESVFLTPREDTPFEAHGRLNFLSATIGGSFFMTSARLAPGPDADLLGRGGRIALNLQQARISNAFTVTNVGALEIGGETPSRSSVPKPVPGWFLLTGAELNGIIDNVDTGWPAAGYLDLEGATYERLRSVSGGDLVRKRIEWLRRQFPNGRPTADCYRPQPYEELSRVLRRHGQAREANAIAVEKIRMRLAAKVDPAWARVFPHLLMLVSHHGYSSSRAVLSFVIFVLLGAAMYGSALLFGQPFVPFEAAPEPVVYALGLLRIATEAGCPGLDILHYALDVALPVINLGQDNYCRFAPAGPWRGFWLLLHSSFAVAGTALSAVVVLTLTGVLRRD